MVMAIILHNYKGQIAGTSKTPTARDTLEQYLIQTSINLFPLSNTCGASGQTTNGVPGTRGPHEMASGPLIFTAGDPRVPAK